MRLLIDTQILLWLLVASPRLTSDVYTALADRQNRVYLSAASTWELAIKVSLGKLDIPRNLAQWLPPELDAGGIRLLPVELDHALGVEHLPRHHGDPFDRLLIAQAIAEDLTIVTSDRAFGRYDVRLFPW